MLVNWTSCAFVSCLSEPFMHDGVCGQFQPLLCACVDWEMSMFLFLIWKRVSFCTLCVCFWSYLCDFRSCSMPVSCHRMILGRTCMRLIGSRHTQWMNGSGSCLVTGARVWITICSRDLTSLLWSAVREKQSCWTSTSTSKRPPLHILALKLHWIN